MVGRIRRKWIKSRAGIKKELSGEELTKEIRETIKERNRAKLRHDQATYISMRARTRRDLREQVEYTTIAKRYAREFKKAQKKLDKLKRYERMIHHGK
jgi:hypothetical protein